MPTLTKNLIDALAGAGHTRQQLERLLAALGRGVVAGLQRGDLGVEDAREELFNLANYQALRKRRLDRSLVEMFQWGMELPTVARITPDALTESYQAISELAHRVIEKPKRKPTKRSRRAA